MPLDRWTGCRMICGEDKECYDRCMGFDGAYEFYKKVLKRKW